MSDVAIVGAGVTGLSIALLLAEGGADVVVYERTGVGAEASGVQPGGVRQQWSTRVNCLLARESLRFYRDVAERLEARTEPVLEPCGYLFLAHSARRRDQLAAEHLERDRTVVPEVLRQPDGRHPAPAELALDPVAVGQGGGELPRGRRHRAAMRPCSTDAQFETTIISPVAAPWSMTKCSPSGITS